MPPHSRYESDEETDQARGRSRPRQKKRGKKDTMGWARERSRSRSRDRRSEVGPPSDEEDETEEVGLYAMTSRMLNTLKDLL